mgnify:CR=1 FL=1
MSPLKVENALEVDDHDEKDMRYYMSHMHGATWLNDGDRKNREGTKELAEAIFAEKGSVGDSIEEVRFELQDYIGRQQFPEERKSEAAAEWRTTLMNVQSTLSSIRALLTLGGEHTQDEGHVLKSEKMEFDPHVQYNGGRGCVLSTRDAHDFYKNKLSIAEFNTLLGKPKTVARIFATKANPPIMAGYYIAEAVRNRPAESPTDVVPEHLNLIDAAFSWQFVTKGIREAMAASLIDRLETKNKVGIPFWGVREFTTHFTHVEDKISQRLL